eukprot:2076007-Pleurochrysis_carterae.AAC.1
MFRLGEELLSRKVVRPSQHLHCGSHYERSALYPDLLLCTQKECPSEVSEGMHLETCGPLPSARARDRLST